MENTISNKNKYLILGCQLMHIMARCDSDLYNMRQSFFIRFGFEYHRIIKERTANLQTCNKYFIYK